MGNKSASSGRDAAAYGSSASDVIRGGADKYSGYGSNVKKTSNETTPAYKDPSTYETMGAYDNYVSKGGLSSKIGAKKEETKEGNKKEEIKKKPEPENKQETKSDKKKPMSISEKYEAKRKENNNEDGVKTSQQKKVLPPPPSTSATGALKQEKPANLAEKGGVDLLDLNFASSSSATQGQNHQKEPEEDDEDLFNDFEDAKEGDNDDDEFNDFEDAPHQSQNQPAHAPLQNHGVPINMGGFPQPPASASRATQQQTGMITLLPMAENTKEEPKKPEKKGDLIDDLIDLSDFGVKSISASAPSNQKEQEASSTITSTGFHESTMAFPGTGTAQAFPFQSGATSGYQAFQMGFPNNQMPMQMSMGVGMGMGMPQQQFPMPMYGQMGMMGQPGVAGMNPMMGYQANMVGQHAFPGMNQQAMGMMPGNNWNGVRKL